MPALRPRNTRTQRQILQAAAERQKIKKSTGTAFIKMAIGISAFVRIPAGTAEEPTDDRAEACRDPGDKIIKAHHELGGRSSPHQYQMTRLSVNRPAGTNTRMSRAWSVRDICIHDICEQVNEAEWAKISGGAMSPYAIVRCPARAHVF